MKKKTILTKAEENYALAYLKHYSAGNLKEALELYRGVINNFAESQEANYARQQIDNIVNTVVPKQEVFDMKINMVLSHFA